ncbi:ATP-dependent helicase hrpb [Heliomicrobium modesticaldum Ice1]|uniref:ATP-dependent helicase hrpb n=1 Tax=Heliobacterium modesticaldum (strain ATCC 51547 / Ice1) TaxID=498761 RepID=B0TA29_HELMI|nr:ATP-dependent helicase HrpB [Heliomicrobium modesticaldum]ABZ83566.1 ATP-dependent helicase hrpb [Heliomicrobium modesticaldum Ice1]
MTSLPIEAILPALKEALRVRTSTVLVAPPGAGKTTRVPLALLNEPWLAGRRIIMLEPRRLAARSAARHMAVSLGEAVGETVGFRVRLETRVGPSTAIEVVTEGVLTRRLQADPALEDVGLVIFDEFHERSLAADLGLALCLQSQALLREDLRILVMSATLDAEPVAALLGDAPIIASEGRPFSVDTRYLERRTEGTMEAQVARTVREALLNDEGDILVFLPGMKEIRRVEARLVEMGVGTGKVRICPLHGGLPLDAQDRAIAPCPPGIRKVVLATSIAETSLTVEGIRVVVDSGLMRVPRFSPRTGMSRLETVPVSRASADQRRGRAGRLGPGVCYRLWTQPEDLRLAPRSAPEILEADLAPLALELAAWGIKDPGELQWLDPPPAAAFLHARELLIQLGALEADGQRGTGGLITPQGRRMAEAGLHPRLAHMVLQAIPMGLGKVACRLAAILSERDFFRDGGVRRDADLRLRLEALDGNFRDSEDVGAAFGVAVDLAARRRILAEASALQRAFGLRDEPCDEKSEAYVASQPEKVLPVFMEEDVCRSDRWESCVDACGLLLAFAFPDRIGQRRPDGRFLLRNGRGAAFADVQPLCNSPYLVAAELDDQGPESRIILAAPVESEDLERYFGGQIEKERLVVWERSSQAVRARQRERLGALVLRERSLADVEPEAIQKALLAGVREEGLAILSWTKAARQFQERLQFMARWDDDWLDASDEALLAKLEDWLGPHLYGMKSRNDLQRLDVREILEATLTWDRRRELDECAPTHILVPSGRRVPIDYGTPEAPVLAVRLQEMFGLKDTPRICRGRVPLTLHLLSPAQRPVQVTQDLASFWRDAYFEVRKDLKGRYPKHYWPEDPREAIPTSRVRPDR